MEKPQSNYKGTVLTPPKNAGTWIGKFWRGEVCKWLTCLMNPRILVNAKQNGLPVVKEAEITMAPNGWNATLDLTAISGSGGTWPGDPQITAEGSTGKMTWNFSSSLTPAQVVLDPTATNVTIYGGTAIAYVALRKVKINVQNNDGTCTQRTVLDFCSQPFRDVDDPA